MNYFYSLPNTAISLFLVGLTVSPIANAQTNPPSSTTNSNTSPKVVSPKQPKSTWETILSLLKGRKEPSLGSRGLICVLSPGLLGENNLIWNTRPLFLWKATFSEPKNRQLEIRLYSSLSRKEDQKLLWSHTTTFSEDEKLSSLIYTGQDLQPSQSYDWELSVPKSQTSLYKFKVMESPKREQIEADLKALETKLKTTGATPEGISLERAQYFAKRDLWSDVLQEMYSVNNPSAELVDKAQSMLNDMCQSSQKPSN